MDLRRFLESKFANRLVKGATSIEVVRHVMILFRCTLNRHVLQQASSAQIEHASRKMIEVRLSLAQNVAAQITERDLPCSARNSTRPTRILVNMIARRATFGDINGSNFYQKYPAPH
jgi:hypothetical protein